MRRFVHFIFGRPRCPDTPPGYAEHLSAITGLLQSIYHKELHIMGQIEEMDAKIEALAGDVTRLEGVADQLLALLKAQPQTPDLSAEIARIETIRQGAADAADRDAPPTP